MAILATYHQKLSRGNEVKRLARANAATGMKLVRVSTGQIVAVFASVGWAWTKIGKMAFLDAGERCGGGLGDELEIMAVMSFIGILVKSRRSGGRWAEYREH